jgi:UDP-glucose 4-epimerase
MGIFMYQVLNNKPLTVYGDGSQKRSFTYIEDVLRPLFNCIEINHEIINLGSGNVYTVKEAAEIIMDITGHKKIEYTPPRHEVKEAFCETDKSEKLLGFCESHTLRDGLEKMWLWAKEQPNRKLCSPPKLEITNTNHFSIK